MKDSISDSQLNSIAKKNIPSYYDKNDEWVEPFCYGFSKGYRSREKKSYSKKDVIEIAAKAFDDFLFSENLYNEGYNEAIEWFKNRIKKYTK